jgi:hypothetical protein
VRRRRGDDAPLPQDHWSRIARGAEELMQAGVRGNYAWCVLHAASVARYQGVPRISVLEFGVAGGNGLVALERAAAAASGDGVEVEVHGFDTGAGLPAPVDHRDTPYVHAAGHFPMDEDALRARLSSASLYLGLVRDTLGAWSSDAPVGFVALDLDYHSSTVDALALFDLPAERLMPRVMVYVDDAHGYPWGDTNGPRAAIREFNAARSSRALDSLYGMRHLVPRPAFDARWPEALWLAHVYDHPRYAEDEGVAFSTRLDLA